MIFMKGLREWAAEVANNENIFKEYSSLETDKEIIYLAKTEGYEFTDKDFDNLKLKLVSGGNKDNFFEKLYENKKIISSIVGEDFC